jgi:heptaprenylglyceryl phosphate synthase
MKELSLTKEYNDLEIQLQEYAKINLLPMENLVDNILMYSNLQRFDIAYILGRQLEILKEIKRLKLKQITNSPVVSLDHYRMWEH